MSGTYRAWEVRGGGLRLARVRRPEPGREWSEVVVCYAGVCGSDTAKLVSSWAGGLPEPWRPGHEIVGVETRTGRLVAVDPLVPCAACVDCSRGAMHLCSGVRRLGWELPGGLAERVLAPAANLVPLPDGVEPAHAVVADPMAVALHGVRCGLPAMGGRLGVIGAGAVGICTAVYAARVGWEVYLACRDVARARELSQVVDARVVADAGEFPACDAVVDAASGGSDRPLRQALGAVRVGGTVLVQNAYAPDVALSMPLRDFLGRSVALRGSFSYCRTDGKDDFCDALSWLTDGAGWLALLTRARYRLDDLPRGLADLRGSKPSRPYKVLLALG